MGLFTRLGDAELGDIAAAFGLGALRRWDAIAAGTINSNFALETERGRFFVRVNEGKAEADVAWEARLVEALAAGGLPTPPPLHAAGDQPYAAMPGAAGKWVSVFPWRAGRHLAPAEVTAAHAAALGEALAALHEIGAALPPAWRRASIYDHDHLAARYRGFAASADPELTRAIAVIGEELALAAAAAPVRRATAAGIIHGDLFRDNVLWDGDHLTAILDFEQASGGSFAYDLAVCVNDWCWDPERAAPREALAGALLAGYQRRRPLPDADRAALPVELRAAAARFTITRITDVYLARVDNPDKDFRAFLARCEAWRGPALGRIIALL
ncbi:MAG TPA: homoserine kinase [Kofleriaceae bacterium]|nr:homoserine kinase [Kofleriaceae bacterium]